MKIYTEEEIKRALNNPVSFNMETDEFIDSLTPIELPSDEEIGKEAHSFYKLELQYKSFIKGAEWMRDKIQGETYLKCTCSNSLQYSNCSKKCERIIDEQGGNNEQHKTK